ncbi:MAG: hypothetical protein AAGD38_23495 [Acidobacteriota bacterium]
MNFLLHRELAWRDLATPGGAIGAMLPDLWRMLDRRARPRHVDRAIQDATRHVRVVLTGVAHHLQADDWFHRHPVFREGERATADRLAAVDTTARHVRLLGHVAWELALDGALLRHRGIDEVCTGLATDIESVTGALPEARRALGIYPTTGDEATFDHRLESLLTDLVVSDWLPGYMTGIGLAARLSRIRQRVGLERFPKADAERIGAALDTTIDTAEVALPTLLSTSLDR